MQFYWYEPVLYYNPDTSYPETKEEPGYFVGFGENVGDALTFKILTLGKRSQILHRSVVRSALDPKAQNKRVKFDKPIPVLEQRDQHKHPKKVFDVEEADPSLRPAAKDVPKKLNYVDELDKATAQPIAKRTRAQN